MDVGVMNVVAAEAAEAIIKNKDEILITSTH
jgi:hypothetical protein